MAKNVVGCGTFEVFVNISIKLDSIVVVKFTLRNVLERVIECCMHRQIDAL